MPWARCGPVTRMCALIKVHHGFFRLRVVPLVIQVRPTAPPGFLASLDKPLVVQTLEVGLLTI